MLGFREHGKSSPRLRPRPAPDAPGAENQAAPEKPSAKSTI